MPTARCSGGRGWCTSPSTPASTSRATTHPATPARRCMRRAPAGSVPRSGTAGEWPEGLYEAEMRVAAFQNGYYVALCNRVGSEEKLTFAGESFVCSPDGRVFARAGQGTDEILYADVDFSRNAESHARRLFLRDRRPELYAEWLQRAGVDT